MLGRKIVAVITSVVLAVSLCPGAATDELAANDLKAIQLPMELQDDRADVEEPGGEPEDEPPFDMWLSGNLSNREKKGVSFDANTCTLTLTNARISGDFGGRVFNIHSWGKVKKYTITLKLVGRSVITNVGNGYGTCLEMGDSYYQEQPNLVVTGSGSLMTKGLIGIATDSGNKHGNISVNSGTLTFKRCPAEGGIVTENGTVALGAKSKLSCTTIAPVGSETAYAVQAKRMKNSYKSLGSIRGKMPLGAEIHNKNAAFKIVKFSDTVSSSSNTNFKEYGNNLVTMTKWIGGSNASFKGILTYNIMGFKYRLSKIASNAFKTKAGAKVKAMHFSPDVKLKVAKNAFTGAKGLENLYIRPDGESPILSSVYGLNGFFCIRNVLKNKNYNRTCFAGVGKSSGKGLVVHVSAAKEEYYPPTSFDGREYEVYDERGERFYGKVSMGFSNPGQEEDIKQMLISAYGFSKNITVSINKSAYKRYWFKLPR